MYECCHHKEPNERFIDLGNPERIWTIPAIHSDLKQLVNIHDQILGEISPGDRIIYLGNYIGYGGQPLETIEELLTFRRMLLSAPGFIPSDIIYLRGCQEEMWSKLLQLHFAPNAVQVLSYIINNGMETMLNAFGTTKDEALRAAKEGVLSTTRWTNKLRENIRRKDGFEAFFSQLKRAAFTCQKQDAPILFVNSGIDPHKKLEEQKDNFWWAGQNFNAMENNFQNFHKVIRGYDPKHQGIHLNCVTASIDAGCGFGGPLVSALVDMKQGEIKNIIGIQ